MRTILVGAILAAVLGPGCAFGSQFATEFQVGAVVPFLPDWGARTATVGQLTYSLRDRPLLGARIGGDAGLAFVPSSENHVHVGIGLDGWLAGSPDGAVAAGALGPSLNIKGFCGDTGLSVAASAGADAAFRSTELPEAPGSSGKATRWARPKLRASAADVAWRFGAELGLHSRRASTSWRIAARGDMYLKFPGEAAVSDVADEMAPVQVESSPVNAERSAFFLLSILFAWGSTR